MNSRRSGGTDFGDITVGEMATAPPAAAAGTAAARSGEKKPGSNGRSNGRSNSRGNANSSTTGKVRNTHKAAVASAAAASAGGSSSKSAKVKKDASNAENRGARPKDKSLNSSSSSSRKKILGTSEALNREHAFASNPDPRGKTEVWLHPSDLPVEYRAAEQDLVVKHKKKPVVK